MIKSQSRHDKLISLKVEVCVILCGCFTFLCKGTLDLDKIVHVTFFLMPFTLQLLFISYKFVKGFLAITFLLHVLVISSWNFHDVCQRFLYNQEQNFSLIRQKKNIFPIDPIIKIAQFRNVMSIDMTLQKWAIFIMGVYGQFSHFLSDPTVYKMIHIMTVSVRKNKQ